jgi:hypothetical protein
VGDLRKEWQQSRVMKADGELGSMSPGADAHYLAPPSRSETLVNSRRRVGGAR